MSARVETQPTLCTAWRTEEETLERSTVGTLVQAEEKNALVGAAQRMTLAGVFAL